MAARELSAQPTFVIPCYPTMGLDMAAAARVYQALFDVARAGGCVLWISEELDDLLRYAHRVAVLFRGRIAGAGETHHLTRERIGQWMSGAADSGLEAAA